MSAAALTRAVLDDEVQENELGALIETERELERSIARARTRAAERVAAARDAVERAAEEHRRAVEAARAELEREISAWIEERREAVETAAAAAIERYRRVQGPRLEAIAEHIGRRLLELVEGAR